MNPLAEKLNATIEAVNPHVMEMLSEKGRRFFFPKGILSQSAEAKVKATRFNATIGTAIAHGQAMALPSVTANLGGMDVNDVLLYAPSPGNKALCDAWTAKLVHDNPSLAGLHASVPVVTNGLTHGLSLIAEMFCNPGDPLIYPDMNWGNYALNFVVRGEMVPCTYSLFDGAGFNITAFREALKKYSAGRSKVVVLLNFPNNPTGYTPTDAEGNDIAAALVELAESGVNVVTVVDDAYYGLFFEDVMRESLFTKLAGRHERLLAIKADAATKEVYVWGLRVGFVSISTKAMAGNIQDLYDAVRAKLGGCIRSVLSNCSALSQQIVLKALQAPSFYAERAANVAVIKERAAKVHEALASNKAYDDAWEAYPFNSGYFMCLRLKTVKAEALRVHLLDTYGVGTIAVGEYNLRIAFSCIEAEHVSELFELIYRGVQDLTAKA